MLEGEADGAEWFDENIKLVFFPGTSQVRVAVSNKLYGNA